MLSPALLLLLLLPPALSARAPHLQGTSWAPHAAYPLRILEACGATLHDAQGLPHLLVAGGYVSSTNLTATSSAHLLALSPAPPVWRRAAALPLPLTHAAQAAVDARLYLCGGFAGRAPGRTVPHCFVYHLPSDAWTPLPDLPAPRAGGGLVYLAQPRALFYASGTLRAAAWGSERDMPQAWILFLDDLDGGWHPRSPMPNARNHMAAITVGGRHYFLGGQHEDREASDNQATVQEYDVWSDTWVERSAMPLGVGHISASVVAFWNGILVVGGINDGRMLSNRVHYYDILADTWTFVGWYPRNVQSPVCDRAGRVLFCATGAGYPGDDSAVYSREMSLPVEL